jgi:glycosyltransferase involved in cell wall biosynthesis
MPAKHLGAKTIVLSPDDAECFTEPTDGPFRWIPTADGADYPDVEGTVVWTRPDTIKAAHGLAMSANGHRVICEVDDNFLSPANQNIFMRQTKDYDQVGRGLHMRTYMTMDAVICSTPILRDTYYRTFKKEFGKAPELYVARNHVDPDDWVGRTPLIETPKQRIRVGWAGSHQHVWDLRLAAPALHLAQEMGAELVLIGLDPAMHDKDWRTFLGNYTHIPWLPPEEYHRRTINLDIGIVPLVMNQHTLGKSDVKMLEYAMSGAAIVGQNNPVYNQTFVHNETCLLAGSPDEMALQVAALIRNRSLRVRLAAAAKQYVLAERTIQGNLNEWTEPIQ